MLWYMIIIAANAGTPYIFYRETETRWFPTLSESSSKPKSLATNCDRAG